MIDYGILNQSIEYYEKAGFTRLETPWTVTRAVSNITKPKEAKDFVLEGRGKVLVASAEQSFLYQYVKGFIPKGTYQSTTPCFRDEIFDDLHTKYFMKNELIKTDNVTHKDLQGVIDIALEFFNTLFNGNCDVIMVDHNESYDISYCGVELGSYGIRKCTFLKWIYGTGCAEPRTSNLIEQYGIS